MKKILLSILLLNISLNCKSQNWSPLATGVDANGVYALCTDTVNNLLYVGGGFQFASSIPSNYIASWNGNNWDSLGSGMNHVVWALEIYNGELYAGGQFNFAGGSPIAYLSKWNGISWAPVSSLINNTVSTLKVHDGALYGVTWNAQIFKWDGSNLTYIPTPAGNTWALESFNNYLIAGGTFTSASGNIVNYISKWDGTSWSAIGNGFNAYVHSLKTYNGYLYAGGEFTYSGGTQANSIARWDGSNWTSLGSGFNCSGNYSSISAIAGYNGKIYACGMTCQAGTLVVNGIAQWDGTNWSAMGTGVNNTAQALSIYNGDLYEGGQSQYAGGVLVNYIAKWGLSSDIHENYQPTLFSAAPNPFLNLISITGTKNSGFVTISDLSGKAIIKQATSDIETTLNTENISSGFYLIHYFDEKTSVNIKIAKQE